jgi:DNA-binding response OmpR family regulator
MRILIMRDDQELADEPAALQTSGATADHVMSNRTDGADDTEFRPCLLILDLGTCACTGWSAQAPARTRLGLAGAS